MLDLFHRKREFCAGALMALVGAFVAQQGTTLRVGTLTNMGPGYFPLTLGILLVLLGVIIAVTSGAGVHAADAESVGFDLRGGICIVLATLAFIGLGTAFGFAAATFSSVFICAMGERSSTIKGSALLAAGLTVMGAIVFTYLLKVPFPLVHWIEQ